MNPFTSTTKSSNFNAYISYCFPTHHILLVTFTASIFFVLLFATIFSILIFRVYKLILFSLENETESDDEALNNEKLSYQCSTNNESVMDTQFRPKVQLMLISISLIIYLLMQITIQIQIFKVYLFKRVHLEQLESALTYTYSILLFIYAIFNFSFYFLARNDACKTVNWCKSNRNYYFEQAEVKAGVFDSNSLKSCSSEEKKEVDVADEKSIESEAVVNANLCLLNELIEKTEGNTNVESITPSSIHYIDATTVATASNHSFTTDQQCANKRKTHVRSGSILSGQFNPEQQLLINSIINENNPTVSPQSTTVGKQQRAPIYVYVDHKYEEKVIKKLKSPISLNNSLKQETTTSSSSSNIWLNKFYESDKPLFKNETSV